MNQNKPKPEIQGKSVPVRTYSFKELRSFYNMSTYKFSLYLLPIREHLGNKRQRIFTPKQVKMIFDELGVPERD